MRTTKAIACISYNSVEFLTMTLNDLKSSGVISFWAFISHLAEPDETKDETRKNHIHLYMEPAKMIQTEKLRDEFNEFVDSDGNLLSIPLGVKFKARAVSKFDDWFMYCCHDTKYLLSKSMTRKYHYQYEDFISSDEEELYMRYREIDFSVLMYEANIIDYFNQGVELSDLVARGQIPIQQLRNTQLMYQLLDDAKRDRISRNKIDYETGEVIFSDSDKNCNSDSDLNNNDGCEVATVSPPLSDDSKKGVSDDE